MDIGCVTLGAWLLFTLLGSIGSVHGQGASAVYSQECEQVIDGVTYYYACLGLPEFILFSENANYQINVVPENMTCGTNGPTEAYTLVS